MGQWVHLKARLHLSESTDGQVQLWQDETKLIDEQGKRYHWPVRFTIAWKSASAPTALVRPATVYVDDVAISDKPID